MPSSGGGRPHPRAQRPLRIATPPSFAAPPESANIHFQFSITCHASTLRIVTPLKKRVRQGRTGWAVGKRPCPASEPHVYLKYSPMYCGPSLEFRGPSATSGRPSKSFGGTEPYLDGVNIPPFQPHQTASPPFLLDRKHQKGRKGPLLREGFGALPGPSELFSGHSAFSFIMSSRYFIESSVGFLGFHS